ncbi:RHS repeat-associated core domain-containing protein [Pseudomonas sp. RL_5y_Pfl2_73]|uniref:RHS repeat-associated core domain-containing protein n=1 Tax=Pseudomonas sp. RL_5y_Pfl2_73 TaxID=3088713 RepID=UPI0030DB77DA
MAASLRETVLCRYRYDPLDRLADCAPSEVANIQRFYCKSRLATEIQGAVQRSVFQHEDQLLAQLRREDVKVDTALVATDQQRSVLNVLDATGPNPLAYTPYGHCPAENGLLSLLGFNGERPDLVTGHYLLGNGYRAFNPVLMRFNSPDSLSPFGEGGLNAYGYGVGDPINWTDPTGHTPIPPVSGVLKQIIRPASASKSIAGQSGRVAKNSLKRTSARSAHVMRNQKKIKNLVTVAEKREKALGQHSDFSVNPPLTDAYQSVLRYEFFRMLQNFEKHPKITKPSFLLQPDGTRMLNTIAYDTRVDVARNLSSPKKLSEVNVRYSELGLDPLKRTSSSQITQAKYARARYISMHTPAKLIRE